MEHARLAELATPVPSSPGGPMTAYTPETRTHLANAEVALSRRDTDTASQHMVQVVRDAPTADVQRLIADVTAAARVVATGDTIRVPLDEV